MVSIENDIGDNEDFIVTPGRHKTEYVFEILHPELEN